MDSTEAGPHDEVRGPGSHALALAGVRTLIDEGVHTILSRVYGRGCEADFEPYLDLARSLGVAEARFIPLRCIGGGLDHLARQPNQLTAFRHLLEVLHRRPELRPLLVRDWFSIVAATLRISARRVSCGIGRRVLFVDADGGVYPCPNHVAPEHRVGTLPHLSLAEALQTPALAAVRDRYHVDAYHPCATCPFRAWCAGDCRGEVLAMTGDPHAPSPHCAELRALYREMLWLLADEALPLGAAPGAATAGRH